MPNENKTVSEFEEFKQKFLLHYPSLIDLTEQQVDDLCHLFELTQQQTSELRKELKEVSDTNENLSNSFKSKCEELDQAKEKIESLKLERDKFESDLADKICEKGTLEEEIELLKKEARIKQLKYLDLHKRFDDYIFKTEKQLINALDSKANIESQLESLQLELSKNEIIISEHNNWMEQAKTEIEELKSISLAKDILLKNYPLAIEQAKKEIEIWSKHVDELEKQEADLCSMNNNLQSQLESLKNELEEGKTMYAFKYNEAQRLFDEKQNQAKTIRENRLKLENNKTHIAALESDIYHHECNYKILEQSLASKDKWVSVNDYLPKLAANTFSECVLCYLNDNSYAILYYDYELKKWTGNRYASVTHWMPLSKSPIK